MEGREGYYVCDVCGEKYFSFEASRYLTAPEGEEVLDVCKKKACQAKSKA